MESDTVKIRAYGSGQNRRWFVYKLDGTYLHPDGKWRDSTADNKGYPGLYPTREEAEKTLSHFQSRKEV